MKKTFIRGSGVLDGENCEFCDGTGIVDCEFCHNTGIAECISIDSHVSCEVKAIILKK